MPVRVDFERPGCSPLVFDEREFIDLLRIELATDGVSELRVRDAEPQVPDERAASRPATTTLAVLTLQSACAPDGTLAIAIDDAATDKRVERVVELGPVPDRARPRVLALASAELLRASWAELIMPDAPPPRAPVPPQVKTATSERLRRASGPGAPPPKPPPAVTPEPPSHARLLLVASPEARFFFRERLGLGGLRIGASLPLGRRTPLRLRGHVGSAYGAGILEKARFDTWLLTTGVGLTGGGSSRSAALEIGPQLDLGWGLRRLRAGDEDLAPPPSDGVMAAVSIVTSGRVHLGGAWWTIADLELGHAVATDAGGATTPRGATAGARLGFALSL